MMNVFKAYAKRFVECPSYFGSWQHKSYITFAQTMSEATTKLEARLGKEWEITSITTEESKAVE